MNIIGYLRRKLKIVKNIRTADSSQSGWRTVNEYQSREIADITDDEKKIVSAENHTLKQQKH